ncbi:MAG: hypothetical protein GX283_06765 [Clostridiaceae bacterium]|nr:hypothetical protein [Clostridiaceae bacterium]
MASVKDKALTSFDIGSCDIISWDITGTESDSGFGAVVDVFDIRKSVNKNKINFFIVFFSA